MRSIGSKFLVAVGAFSVAFSVFILFYTWAWVRYQTEDLIANQAALALQFDLAIRHYVGREIRPVMEEHVGKDVFIPETMSTSFIARRIFEDVHEEFPDYVLKFSSDDPRNPANQAGPEERELLQYFRDNPQATHWTGHLQMEGKSYFVHCVPRRLDEGCLRCHGRPADAPAALVAQYGAKAGFHRAVGDVIALDTMAIPTDRAYASINSHAATQLAVVALGVGLLFVALLVVFRCLVARRLAAITAHFRTAAEQDEDAPIAPVAVTAQDEIGVLAGSFNALAARLQRMHATLEKRVEERTAALGEEISERKRVETQLAKAKSGAEAANRAKSEFLANMSHEIRTPMTAILGYIDLLSDACTQRCPLDLSQMGNPLEVVRKNARHLLRIIDDVLDLSKIEAGKLVVEQVACSPCQIITEVVSLMRVRSNAKHLNLALEFNGPVPETIQSDPMRLRQVLVNIVGNAIKFTETGEVRLVMGLKHSAGSPLLEIQVTDTGMGMSEELLARLFRPFTQADTSTTRSFGGTGLGLTISKRLAEMLGGDVTVRSSVGRGSTFTITVPTGPLDGVALIEAPSEVEFRPSGMKAEEAVTTQSLPDGCRLLLAEDGPDNQRLISFLLRKAGAEVVIADNGQTAVELALEAVAQARPFDLILMDMQMPVLDGYDATKQLRAAGYAQPILALTAHAMATDRQKCLDAGCDDYLSKPIDRQALLKTVAKHSRPKSASGLPA